MPPVTEVPRLTFYTRQGCHLCDVAYAEVEALAADWRFDLERLDVDTDPELVARWGDTVPVILVEGRLAAKVRVDPRQLERRLEAAGATRLG